MSGRFIAVEGLDGSGGTTQVGLLASRLRRQGVTVHLTREPSDGPVGQLIRATLRGQVDLPDPVLPFLFAADRRHHLDREILPRLERGDWVISDRYLASSLAYQSLISTLDRVAELNAEFPLPDLTLYLDLSPAVCVERITTRGEQRERFEQLESLGVIMERYDHAMTWCRRRGGRVVEIDGRG